MSGLRWWASALRRLALDENGQQARDQVKAFAVQIPLWILSPLMKRLSLPDCPLDIQTAE